MRPAFMRDTEKILHLPAYTRYAGKTQVFSFRSNDDLSRRGLHVQLVSRIARDIGRALGLNCDLIEAIGLGLTWDTRLSAIPASASSTISIMSVRGVIFP